jgi:hypothetical protein
MGKRNKSTRNLIETEDPEPPQEDEGISSPWNFQVCPPVIHSHALLNGQSASYTC